MKPFGSRTRKVTEMESKLSREQARLEEAFGLRKAATFCRQAAYASLLTLGLHPFADGGEEASTDSCQH